MMLQGIPLLERTMNVMGTTLLLLSGCAAPEPVVEREPVPVERPEPEEDRELTEGSIREGLDEFERVLFDSRSSLSDQCSSITNDVPEAFRQDASLQHVGVDIAGYRVHILSTRDVAAADSALDDFRLWAASNLDEYSDIEVSIYFRQPYLRVRRREFRSTENAIGCERIARQLYPAALVEHDRIHPDNISD